MLDSAVHAHLDGRFAQAERFGDLPVRLALEEPQRNRHARGGIQGFHRLLERGPVVSASCCGDSGGDAQEIPVL